MEIYAADNKEVWDTDYVALICDEIIQMPAKIILEFFKSLTDFF